MNENLFWNITQVIGAMLIAILIVSIFAYKTIRNEAIIQMVKQGSEPVLAACSLNALPDNICLPYLLKTN